MDGEEEEERPPKEFVSMRFAHSFPPVERENAK